MNHNGWSVRRSLSVGALVSFVILLAGASVAFAALTFSTNSISGDSDVNIDGSGTVSIGSTSATGVTVGSSGITTSFPGAVSIGGTTSVGDLVVNGTCTGCGGAGGGGAGVSSFDTRSGNVVLNDADVSSTFTNPHPGQVLQFQNGLLTSTNASSVASASRGELVKLNAALESGAQTWVVAMPGDSILAGNGPPDNEDSFWNQTVSDLKNQFQNAGTANSGADQVTADTASVSGGSCTPAYGAGPGNSGTYSGTVFNYTQDCPNGTTMTFSNIGTGTDIGMVYYTSTDSTNPTIAIDGSSVSFTSAGPTSSFTPHYVDFGGLTAATNHTVTITSTGAFYPMFVVALQNTTSGVLGLNFSKAGSTAFAFSGNLSNFLSVLPNLDLVYGGEWQNGGGSVSAVVQANKDVYTEANSLGVPFVLLITGPSSTTDTCTTSPCPTDFANGLEAFASQNDIPTVDLFQAWGRHYLPAIKMFADGVHPSLAGSDDAAKLSLQVVRGFDQYFNDYNAGINVSTGIDFATNYNPGFHAYGLSSGGLLVDGYNTPTLKLCHTVNGNCIIFQVLNGGDTNTVLGSNGAEIGTQSYQGIIRLASGGVRLDNQNSGAPLAYPIELAPGGPGVDNSGNLYLPEVTIPSSGAYSLCVGTNKMVTSSSTGCAGSSGTAATATPGSGVTSVTCATATCTSARGTFAVVGGTATTGTIFSISWSATPTAQACSATMNGGTGFIGLGHSVATTTGMNITANESVSGMNFDVDYTCEP